MATTAKPNSPDISLPPGVVSKADSEAAENEAENELEPAYMGELMSRIDALTAVNEDMRNLLARKDKALAWLEERLVSTMGKLLGLKVAHGDLKPEEFESRRTTEAQLVRQGVAGMLR